MIDPYRATTPSLLESSESTEIETRLGLYQLFLKIYKHHRHLLDDILRLENVTYTSPSAKPAGYVQVGVEQEQPYLIANLLDGKTQRLFQPEGIWLVGRSSRANIPIREQSMSRIHAAIQYVRDEGFYLIDLGSTNGSFVNSEPVWQQQLLKDGDQIRLGSVAISFFICQTSQTLKPINPEILAQIKAVNTKDTDASAVENDPPLVDNKSMDTGSMALLNRLKEPPSTSSLSPLSESVQSEILDRFFSQQMPAERN